MDSKAASSNVILCIIGSIGYFVDLGVATTPAAICIAVYIFPTSIDRY